MPLRVAVLRHAVVRGAHARRAARLARRDRGRRGDAAGQAARPRPAGVGLAGQGARRIGRPAGAAADEARQRGASSRRCAALAAGPRRRRRLRPAAARGGAGMPRLGLVNVHASLLPRWRGASPIERAIIDGDRETGVTIMRVVKALDAGAMLAVARTPIDPDETGEALEARLSAIGASLLVSTLPALAGGTAREVPQDEATRHAGAAHRQDRRPDRLGRAGAHGARHGPRAGAVAARLHLSRRAAARRARDAPPCVARGGVGRGGRRRPRASRAGRPGRRGRAVAEGHAPGRRRRGLGGRDPATAGGRPSRPRGARVPRRPSAAAGTAFTTQASA